MNPFQQLILLSIGLTVMNSCKTIVEPKSSTKFESAHSILMDATIEQGQIFSHTLHRPTLEAEIIEQLYYLRGQLTERNGISDNPLSHIQITATEDLGEGIYKIRYKATLRISWPVEIENPGNIDIYLPRFGDQLGRDAFFARFANGCISTDHQTPDIEARYYWYYFQINGSRCSVKVETEDQSVSSPIKLNLNMVVSNENTQDHSPEYLKIWEDHTLVVTEVRGMSSLHLPMERSDQGASSFNSNIRRLLYLFGLPSESNVDLSNRQFDFARAHVPVHLKWDRLPDQPGRKLDIMLIFIEEISLATDEQRNLFNQRSKISDVMIYSGHSGLGGNIRNFANMGQFQRGHYQLYVLNGCITFSYQDNTIFNRHGAVNNPARPTKYLDVISNAMPGTFMDNNLVSESLIQGLLAAATYRQILSNFPIAQRANVTGEEDNIDPSHFTEDLPEFSPCNPSWGPVITCLNVPEDSYCEIDQPCAAKACQSGKLIACPNGCSSSNSGSDDHCVP